MPSQFDSGKRRPHSNRPETQAAHAGDDPFLFLGAASPGILQTSTFVFETFDDMAEAFAHPEEHALYTRGNNPTVRVAEEKIAALEGADSCRLFGSGMAAISSVIMANVRSGGHIISLKTVYGPAYNFLMNYLPRLGVETTLVDGTDPAEFEAALKPNTTFIYLESPSTMVMKLQDLQAVASLARKRGIRTAVDNSYHTMLLQRPLDLGIDYSVYSATKYINGHSDVVAGAVVARRELIHALSTEHQLFGGIIGPFEGWLIARGLRTMPARMRQHRESAAQVVDFLVKHPKVSRVYYPGHASHPQYELACRQTKGASSLLSFEIDSPTVDRMRTLANAVQYFGLGVSWGGHESLLTMPLIQQSKTLPPEEWTNPGLVRIHVGLEAAEDLVADLDQALAKL